MRRAIAGLVVLVGCDGVPQAPIDARGDVALPIDGSVPSACPPAMGAFDGAPRVAAAQGFQIDDYTLDGQDSFALILQANAVYFVKPITIDQFPSPVLGLDSHTYDHIAMAPDRSALFLGHDGVIDTAFPFALPNMWQRQQPATGFAPDSVVGGSSSLSKRVVVAHGILLEEWISNGAGSWTFQHGYDVMQLAPGAEAVTEPSLSPDAKMLVYTVFGSEPAIWAAVRDDVDLPFGKPRSIFAFATNNVRSPQLEGSCQRLWFIDELSALVRVDLP
jgi:hypothetical protein